MVNGEPAIVTMAGDRILGTTSIATDGERIVAFMRVLNPDKLQRLRVRIRPAEGTVPL